MVAVIQVFLGLGSGSPIVHIASVAATLVFLMGAMGVREASWPAAAMVFALFFTDILYTLAVGRLPGVLAIICAGVLLSNVRAAFLASRWKPASEGEDRPTRFNEDLRDLLIDQLPSKAWPILQIPFFSLAGLLLLLSLAGVCAVVWQRLGGAGQLHT